MRDRFPITNFNSGIITRADAEDIPDNAASDSNNIDGDAPEGILMGIPASTTKANSNSLAQASHLFAWVKTKDSKWNLVHCNGTTASGYLNVIVDFYATTPTENFGATDIPSTATSMVEHGEEVHVAVGTATPGTPTAPKWIGYCDWTHFGGSTLGWQYDSTVLVRPTYTTHYTIGAVGHTGTAVMKTDKIYQYNLSTVYDGVQESVLGSAFTSFDVISYGNNADYVTITVTVVGFAGINNRITGYNLYRRETDLLGAPTSLWRLQQEFDATATAGYTDRNNAVISWGTSGSDKTIVYIDNDTDVLSSYEEQTGIAESLTSSDVYYSLNTDLNGFHFVAGCAKTGLPEASMMMFRSKQYRYDMFNWTNDYLKLPTVPTALKSFAGKIWAFDENNLYRINPDGMYIEDTTSGIGCLSQRSITITDYGMFWCDYKNAYWHDGEKIIPIGDAVRTDVTTTYDWTGFAKNYTVGLQSMTPIVVFHSPKHYVMFIVPDHTGVVSNVWAFHVQKKRWDKWTSFTQCGTTSSGFGAFSGKNGEVYVSTGVPAGSPGLLVEPLGGATWRSFYWTSKVLDFGQPARLKRFKAINTELTSTTSAPTVTYGLDRATPTSSFSAVVQGKLFQIKITEATGYGNKVYSTEILFRRLSEL